MELTTPPHADSIILGLLDSLGRERALTDAESILLEAIIRRQKTIDSLKRRWTRKEDQQLLRLHRAGKQAPFIAEHLNRSKWGVRHRLDELRKKDKAKAARRNGYGGEHG